METHREQEQGQCGETHVRAGACRLHRRVQASPHPKLLLVMSSQTCQVMTLGGGGRNRQWWRNRPRPPAMVSVTQSSSWSVAVVAGVAYFLLQVGQDEPDSIAVFDMATEEWKPTTIQGPLSTSLLQGEEGRPCIYPTICRRQFRLARLKEGLVTVYCNLQDCSTDLWLLVDMDESVWTKQYMLRGTQFGDEFFLHYHYPLAVLDDGRVLIWVERTGELRAYDPRTSTWADLATVSGAVASMHHGSLLCSNLGGRFSLELM